MEIKTFDLDLDCYFMYYSVRRDGESWTHTYFLFPSFWEKARRLKYVTLNTNFIEQSQNHLLSPFVRMAYSVNSFKKCLLRAYSVPGTMLETGKIRVEEQDVSVPGSLHFWGDNMYTNSSYNITSKKKKNTTDRKHLAPKWPRTWSHHLQDGGHEVRLPKKWRLWWGRNGW